jgi:predicted O-methyltransferase YrrM
MGSEIITQEDDLYFYINGTRFRQLRADSKLRKTTDDEVLILKSPRVLRKYDKVFTRLPTANVLEFGVAEGGSILYFAQAFPEFRYVGIDLREPNEALLHHIERARVSDRVKIYYGTGQDDGRRINEIIRENFGQEPLGCVIDDASHMYRPSRHTFETTFGQLAPNGLYCIENWSWAHQHGHYQTNELDKPALTNLLFEIVMLAASTEGVIGAIDIDTDIAMVRRGDHPEREIRFDKLIMNRKRKLELI